MITGSIIAGVLLVVYGICEISYRAIEVEDNACLSYKTIMALRKTAPEKWTYSGCSGIMYYCHKPGQSKRAIYPTTLIDKLLLRFAMARAKTDGIRDDWLEDINEYQKKKEAEAEAEISQSSKDIADLVNILRDSRTTTTVSKNAPSYTTEDILNKLNDIDLKLMEIGR